MDGLPISQMTPVGLLCLVLASPYLLIGLGRLIPKSSVDRMIREHERELAAVTEDRDHWRDAHTISEQARSVSSAQTGELLEQSRTTNDLLRSLPRGPGRESM